MRLQNEIDPTNSEFLDFSLQFLTSLDKPNPDPTKDQLNFAPWFVRYLLKLDTQSLLHEELTFLVYFVTKKQEESSENSQSLVTEIKAMLLGVGFLYQSLPVKHKADYHLCYFASKGSGHLERATKW